MLVGSILAHKGGSVITINRATTIAEAASALAKHRIGAVVVTDPDDSVAGILSERDIVRGIAQRGAPVLERPCSELMTPAPFVCRRADTLDSIMQLMTDRRIRHLPVVENGRMEGIISIGDVVKQRLEEMADETDALRDYVAGRA